MDPYGPAQVLSSSPGESMRQSGLGGDGSGHSHGQLSHLLKVSVVQDSGTRGEAEAVGAV